MFQKILPALFTFLLLGTIAIHNSFADTNSTASSPSQLRVNITEIKAPEKTRLSPFVFYDNHRNVIWIGDITANSGKIIEFELNSSKFVIRQLPGADVVTHIAMDSKGSLWYTDPIANSLGQYNPDDNSNKIYSIPNNATLLGITLDNTNNVWIIIFDQTKILEFDTQKEKFNTINLPSTSSLPLAITSDKSGKVWIAESLGKIASIDPLNYSVTEFGPPRLTFSIPTSIISDPVTRKIYFSEHNAYVVSEFDPTSQTFKRYNLNFGGFPAGLTFDNHGNLWVAQHTLDKVAAIDTITGHIKQFDLPQGSLVQWLEKDSHGNIMFVDQRSNVLGIIKIAPAPVPEFPFATPILLVGITSMVIFYRTRLRK